jgi:hypothetical protein
MIKMMKGFAVVGDWFCAIDLPHKEGIIDTDESTFWDEVIF